MTTEKAIWAMQFYKEKLYNGIFNQYIDAFDEAISALRDQQEQTPCSRCGYGGKHMDAPPCTTCPAHPKGQQPNAPLALDELRSRVGKWVWVVVNYEHCTCDGWALVPTPAFVAYLDQTIPIDLCGKKFLAYDHKPEPAEEGTK